MNNKTKSNFDTEIHTVCIKFIKNNNERVAQTLNEPGPLAEDGLVIINFIQTV